MSDHDDYTTPRYIFEWNDGNAAVGISVVLMLMQVINPAIIYCVIQCVSAVRANKVEQEVDAELQNLHKNYQTTLDIFRQNNPQPEEEYDAVTADQFSRIHADYQKSVNEITEQKEARKSKSEIKVKFCRLFSLYAYVTFWIFVLYIILVGTTRLFGGVFFFVMCGICAILVVVTYIIVLLEHLVSSERQYIQNLSSSVFAVERIETIRAAQPSIFFQAECYHYETRTRTITYYINGNLQTREETYQEKVVTNLILEPVSFQYWRDTSPPELAGINDKGITKIKMTLSVEPGDDETRIEFESQYNAFQNAHENLDVHVDCTIEKRVPGFEKRLAAYTDNREKPTWVSNAFFLAATILFLSWPYRWAFKSITSKTQFVVSKLVYLSRSEENNLPGLNSYVATGNDDTGEHLKPDSTAVTIESDQASSTTNEHVNANSAQTDGLQKLCLPVQLWLLEFSLVFRRNIGLA